VLAIHAWTAVFVSLGIAQGQWNVNEGLGRLLLQRTLLAAGLNILLNGVLIPRAGAAGAAIATLVSQAFATVIANALDRRTRGILRMQLRAFLPW
jgi:PST family polysaccharide transporter